MVRFLPYFTSACLPEGPELTTCFMFWLLRHNYETKPTIGLRHQLLCTPKTVIDVAKPWQYVILAKNIL